VANNLNLRGSINTGFRAPSLQQINYSSTFTTVQGATITEVKIAPNYSPITKAAGIPELKQERSVNGSLGFTYTPIRELSITVDGYWVHIKDRVVLSGQFAADEPGIDPGLAATMQNLRVGFAQFFANADNTTNRGIDVVIDYNRRVGNSRYRMLLTGNIQKMDIDKINVPTKLSGTDNLQQTFLSERERKFILASAPPSKIGFNLEYGYKKLTVGTRITRFGQIIILGYGENGSGINPTVPTDADPNIHVPDQYIYSPKAVTDLYASYQLHKNFTLYVGADNIFNVHPGFGVAPGAKLWAYNNEPGGPWDPVQMGHDGRKLFTRLAFNF
jgi:iron complex outermembrane receptor protein